MDVRKALGVGGSEDPECLRHFELLRLVLRGEAVIARPRRGLPKAVTSAWPRRTEPPSERAYDLYFGRAKAWGRSFWRGGEIPCGDAPFMLQQQLSVFGLDSVPDAVGRSPVRVATRESWWHGEISEDSPDLWVSIELDLVSLYIRSSAVRMALEDSGGPRPIPRRPRWFTYATTVECPYCQGVDDTFRLLQDWYLVCHDCGLSFHRDRATAAS